MIIDYSLWRPKAQTDVAGVNGVLRYISHDENKTVTARELEQLHGWGIGTGLVFEDAGDRATAGAGAGAADAQFALEDLYGLGVPAGRPLYVAVDFDIPDYAPASGSAIAKLGPVGEYLHEFGLELSGHGHVLGVYGGYWAVTRAMDAGLSAWCWQTVAWSPEHQGIRQQDRRIRLYQTGVQVLAGNADLNFAGTRDWGQFRRETRWITGAGA